MISSRSLAPACISGRSARGGALHQHLDDEHAVDFVGALEDAVDARVAVEACHGIIFVEAVAAIDLDGLIDC